MFADTVHAFLEPCPHSFLSAHFLVLGIVCNLTFIICIGFASLQLCMFLSLVSFFAALEVTKYDTLEVIKYDTHLQNLR